MSFSVLKSARVISVLTLASRILGLVRDMAFSAAFGTSSVQSAFQFAFQIPNLFRRLFGEGALSAASIPVLTEALHNDGQESMDAVAGKLVGLLLAGLATLCLVAEIVVGVCFWHYRGTEFWGLTLALTAVMMPYVLLVCTLAVLGGIQNVFGRFALPAAMPILLNVFLIAAILLAPRWTGTDKRQLVFIQAGAVLLAGVVQVGLQWWAVRRSGLSLRLSLDYFDPAIRKIGLTMLPMIAGLGAVQLNTFADGLIASWFVIDPDGQRPGMSILYFAQRLYQFPLGVFLVALATAIFPALSRHAAARDDEGLGRTLARGIRVALFIVMPCMAGLILVREPLVRTLFNYGAFKNSVGADVRVATALGMYSAALWAYGLNHLVIRAFYALQDSKTPLKVAAGTVVLNLALNLILVRTPLREAGLALATAIGASVQFVVLLAIFRRRVGFQGSGLILTSAGKILAATAGMSAVLLAIDHFILAGQGEPLRLAVLVVVGGGTYLGAVWALGCGELGDLVRR